MSFTLETDNSKSLPEKLAFKPGRFNEIENRLSDAEFKAVNYIEQYWWEFSEVPSLDVLEQKTGISSKESQGFWKNENVVETLKRRSLPVEKWVSGDTELLTREQLIVANMMLNIADKTSMREKLKKVGVKPAQYQAWCNDPAFINYMRARTEELFGNADADAKLSLIKGIEAGDFQSTKLYMEIRGIYNPRVQVDVNIEQVLVRVVDIVARHVNEPSILEAIATEIEELAGSSKKAALPVAEYNAQD